MFSGAVTSYQASVDHAVEATTVTATASHPEAAVSIQPGPEVSLAVGANEIAVTVTAEDGTATQTYTVTVTRAAPRLTGRFMSVPEAHSGSGTVVLRILFSEPLPTSFSSFLVGGGDTLQVTNGAVRGARAVDGRGDLWEITLAPSSVADMVVVLPATVIARWLKRCARRAAGRCRTAWKRSYRGRHCRRCRSGRRRVR